MVLQCVALLLGEVRLRRLELADDLVALLGDRLAHLEHFRDLSGVLALDRNRARQGPFPRLRLPTNLANTGLAAWLLHPQELVMGGMVTSIDDGGHCTINGDDGEVLSEIRQANCVTSGKSSRTWGLVKLHSEQTRLHELTTVTGKS